MNIPIKKYQDYGSKITKPIAFTLVVDNFGIIYISKNHINHLLKEIEERHLVKIDWAGSKYLGIDLK